MSDEEGNASHVLEEIEHNDNTESSTEGSISEFDDMANRPGSLPLIKVDGDHNVNMLVDHKWSISNPHVHLVPRREGMVVLPKRYQDLLIAHKRKQEELRKRSGYPDLHSLLLHRATYSPQSDVSENSMGDRKLSGPQDILDTESVTEQPDDSDPEGTLKARKGSKDKSETKCDTESLDSLDVDIPLEESDSEGTLKAHKKDHDESDSGDELDEGTLKARKGQHGQSTVSEACPSQEPPTSVDDSEQTCESDSEGTLKAKKSQKTHEKSHENDSQEISESAEIGEELGRLNDTCIDMDSQENDRSVSSSHDDNNNEANNLVNTGDYNEANNLVNRDDYNEDIDEIERYKVEIMRTGKWADRLEDLDIAMKWIRQEVIQIKQEDRFLMRRLLDLRARIHQLQGMPQHLSLSSNLAMLGSRGSNMDGATWSSFISLDERVLGKSGPATDSPMTLKDLLNSFHQHQTPPTDNDFCGEGTLGRGLRGFGTGLGDISRSASTREPIKPPCRIKRKNSLPMANELEEDHFFDDQSD